MCWGESDQWSQLLALFKKLFFLCSMSTFHVCQGILYQMIERWILFVNVNRLVHLLVSLSIRLSFCETFWCSHAAFPLLYIMQEWFLLLLSWKYLSKLYLSNSMHSKVIQLWMKCFNFVFATSTQSSYDNTFFFQITSKRIELDRCGLCRLLSNLKGYIYVSNFFKDRANLPRDIS